MIAATDSMFGIKGTMYYRIIALSLILLLPAGNAAATSNQPKTTEPHNSLERHLLAVQQGERDLPRFLDELVDSQVVLLSKREVLEQRTPADIPALILPTGEEDEEMLAVFTSPALAHRVAATYPEYRYGVETQFLWVLAHTAPGLGVVINPGWTLGMKIPSYGLLRLRERYSDRIEQAQD